MILRASVVAGLLALAAAPAAEAASGSILYKKAGALWVTSPDGKKRKKIPRSGRLENPSQDNRGTIVAQRGINLYRLNRRGKRLNKPITTAFRTNPILPDFKGPFWPEVSPDGKKIAYTYSLTAQHYDPGCSC